MERRIVRASLAIALVASVLGLAGPGAQAQTPPSGIYLADAGANGVVDGKIVRVNPTTGQQVVVAAGPNLTDPSGLTFGPDGMLYVADPNGIDAAAAANGPGRILRVNPTTGAQSVITTGGNLQDPVGIKHADGRLYVADAASAGGPGRVVTVDPANGNQTVLAAGTNITSPPDVLVDNGSLIVSNIGPAIRVIRIDKANGNQSVITTGNNLLTAGGLAPSADPNVLYVADAQSGGLPASAFPPGPGVGVFIPGGVAPGKIVAVNKTTGIQSVVSAAGNMVNPTGLVTTANPTIWVGDAGPALDATIDGRIVRVNPANGAQSVVTAAGNLINPIGITVSPDIAQPGGTTPPTPTGSAPAFTAPTCGATVQIPVFGNAALAGTVAASAGDADAGQTVSLAATGLPTWATFSSTAGNPATGSITASPSIIDWLLGFISPASTATITATDSGTPARTATCTVTLRVNLLQGSPI